MLTHIKFNAVHVKIHITQRTQLMKRLSQIILLHEQSICINSLWYYQQCSQKWFITTDYRLYTLVVGVIDPECMIYLCFQPDSKLNIKKDNFIKS